MLENDIIVHLTPIYPPLMERRYWCKNSTNTIKDKETIIRESLCFYLSPYGSKVLDRLIKIVPIIKYILKIIHYFIINVFFESNCYGWSMIPSFRFYYLCFFNAYVFHYVFIRSVFRKIT